MSRSNRSRPTRERTAQERELDREERARRRGEAAAAHDAARETPLAPDAATPRAIETAADVAAARAIGAPPPAPPDSPLSSETVPAPIELESEQPGPAEHLPAGAPPEAPPRAGGQPGRAGRTRARSARGPDPRKLAKRVDPAAGRR
ncbi:MAG: hypothetical protein ACHQAV_01545, partial [Solirubrobacterales bacterium]